jgi:metal-responsive CopG/Arc/MetJ family transcriptional regulator
VMRSVLESKAGDLKKVKVNNTKKPCISVSLESDVLELVNSEYVDGYADRSAFINEILKAHFNNHTQGV